MRQYAIDKVELSWQGLDLKPGLAAGTSVTEARNAPTWTNKPTGQGRVVRVYNPDRSGTISIVVDQESSVHQDLRSLAQTDRISRNIVGTLMLHDTTSGEIMFFKNSYISTEPDETRGTDSATFTWVFNFEDYEKTISIDQNIVGA